MSSAIQEHELAQEKLMDALVKLIASTIDEKSPYTGGHCQRVPEIAMMLAKAAQESDRPPFSQFGFKTRDEWREFEIAAWLHDCGKIVTPEHIVDKATKLEMIYNRINEIRMRFEVLLRDAQISYWKERAKGSNDDQALTDALAETENRLKEDFEFIAQCNIGGEFMAQDKLDRLNAIGKQTWIRHFDDRLGLSPVETAQLQEPAGQLPCEEALLSDSPGHKIPRDPERIRDDKEFGFKMEIPELKQNQGEYHNLSIARGTLTQEDRYIIQEHITATIRMLDLLPFPKELDQIPDIAGAHHETLIGNGYPRQLKGEEISIPGRILTIADIFEALTASDRPYKKAKPLGAALDIMKGMAKRGHIDQDLFHVF